MGLILLLSRLQRAPHIVHEFFKAFDFKWLYYRNPIIVLLTHRFLSCQIREGRKQTLAECLKKEFRLTMNILRTMISEDVYEVHYLLQQS